MIPIQNTISIRETANHYTNFTETPLIATHVFSYLSAKELGRCLSVCKQWNEYASNEALWNNLVPEMAFGPREWNLYFGDIENAPSLPRVIYQILNAPCPIWPGKRVHETHLLTLIPQTVNGQPLTLKSLGELVQAPLQGYPTKYSYFNLVDYSDQPTPFAHWTLLSRDVILQSRSKKYSTQKQLAKQYQGYTMPLILDATVSIFMEYVKSGTRLYPERPEQTYTRCQALSVGNFTAYGLQVLYDFGNEIESSGVGISRMFT